MSISAKKLLENILLASSIVLALSLAAQAQGSGVPLPSRPSAEGSSSVEVNGAGPTVPFRVTTIEEKVGLGQEAKSGDRVVSPWCETDAVRQNSPPERFNWNRALAQTATMLAVQHGFRLFQKKTHSELDGPFFRDWGKSVKALKGWGDSDGAFVNYFAHPLQGATTGRIFLTNSPGAESVRFGGSKRYWKTRFKALAWSAAWSAQFELGPFSEATIGNVGLRKKNGKGTMGWVDLIVTPTAGTAIIVGEDALERFVIRKMLRNGRATPKVKLLRSIFAPSHSLNNLLKGKAPWKREETLQFDDSRGSAKRVGNRTQSSR